MDLFLDKVEAFANQIIASNSRLYKLEILENLKNDADLRYFLDFLFNPYITTGLSKKKLTRDVSANSQDYFETAIELLDYLKEHNTGRDEDIAKVRYFEIVNLNSNKELIQLLRSIISKDLPLGIDTKTINKVIPGLIPEFNVQLSNKYFDKPEVVEGKEFSITTKIDGSRIVAMKDNGQVIFWTRQGQKYEGLVDLETELKNVSDDNFVLDGEIVAINTDKENTYKNTMKLSRTKDLEKHGLKMLVFDYMPIANFKAQRCPIAYHSRRAMLSALFDLNELKFFEKLPILYKGTDTSKVTEILDEQVAKGEEGIMINIWDAPYEFKRTNNLLKVKKFQDTEVEIIGFEEGTNKLAGTLGAFVCKYKDNEVRVGSGLTDEDRAYFWANRDKFLGKFITVKYFETSIDSKTGLESLRFPIYLRVREDI